MADLAISLSRAEMGISTNTLTIISGAEMLSLGRYQVFVNTKLLDDAHEIERNIISCQGFLSKAFLDLTNIMRLKLVALIDDDREVFIWSTQERFYYFSVRRLKHKESTGVKLINQYLNRPIFQERHSVRYFYL